MSERVSTGLPSDWVEAPLSRVIESLDAGVSVNAEDRPHAAGEVGVLKTSAIGAGTFDPRQNKTVIPKERRLVSECVVADSILVSRMNTPELVGETCYVSSDWPTLFLPDRIWQLKPKDRRALSMRWLSYVLRSYAYRRYVEKHASGTSGSMKNIPKARMLDMRLVYPPIAQQRSIASVLETLDTAIRQTEAIIDKLKQLKQGLLHDLLTRGIDENGELRPPQSEATHLYKQSPLGWIPKEWVGEHLERLTTKIVDGVHHTPKYVSHGVPFLTVQNLTRTGDIDFSQLSYVSERDHRVFRLRADPMAGDVLVTKDGTLGVARLVRDKHPEFSIFVSVAQLRPIQSKLVPGLLLMFFESGYHERQLGHLSAGSGLKHIHLEHFRRFIIPVASTVEQEAVVTRSAGVEQRIHAEERYLSNLTSIKSGLMDDLLTGRVRVPPLLKD